MFYKYSNSAHEMEESVFNTLSKSNKEQNINLALQSLANSAEIFESLDLQEEAEVITQFIETIASGQFEMVKEAKRKAKKKLKKKVKQKAKTNKYTKNLNPENQVKNLAEVGWVFNAPCFDCEDCEDCDDVMSSDDILDIEYDIPESGVFEKSKIEEELPEDYERCGECGYSHDYEPTESWLAHNPQQIKDKDYEDVVDMPAL